MKTLIITTMFLVAACNNPARKKPEPLQQETVSTIEVQNHTDSFADKPIYKPGYALWGYEYDTLSKTFAIVKLRSFRKDTLTIQGVAALINTAWPKVQVHYLKSAHDTLFLSIPESEELTQQLGTTGAEQFMISATYSFTELKGVRCVSFDFVAGDHASPGVYTRRSWNK